MLSTEIEYYQGTQNIKKKNVYIYIEREREKERKRGGAV